jgi:hypothetical protein
VRSALRFRQVELLVYKVQTMSYPKTQAFAEKYFYDMLKYNYVDGTIDEFRSHYINSPKAHINLINNFEEYHLSILPSYNPVNPRDDEETQMRRMIMVEAMAKKVDWDKLHKYIKECDDRIRLDSV